MTKAEIAKRYLLFIISLFFAAMGVAFTKHGELGVSPISSVANVMSCRFDSLSLGTWLIIWNCVLIAGQIAILGKKFQMIQLLQVPLSFLFGWFTDFGMWLVSFLPANSYPVRLIVVVVGIVILGFGISLSVIANVIMNSGEAFVKAISDTLHKEFGNVKIAFDIICVILAITLSVVFFHFSIVGTREGTIISALLTGIVVKFFSNILSQPLNLILKGKNAPIPVAQNIVETK
ncbi:MAG: YitT family protein [Lachnospiraceae bacterium]|nr:YitT family protein [Lachnospiraceae bacterium]